LSATVVLATIPSAPLVTAIPFSATSITVALARFPFSSSCLTSRFDGLPSMETPFEAGAAQPTPRRPAPERISAMRQLTSLDAQFLALESSHQTGHVAGLTILDPSTTKSGELTFADIRNLIEERLPLLPPLRWRLVEVPFGLDYPYWLDDEDFDLDFHVRELALPPGGAREK